MPAAANGRPNTTQVTKFIEGAANPVYLTTGPGGDVFYADFDGGTIHRITFASGNLPPDSGRVGEPDAAARRRSRCSSPAAVPPIPRAAR